DEHYRSRTFSELLEDASKEDWIELDKHKTSCMYIVTGFGLEMKSSGPPLVVQPPRMAAPKIATLPPRPIEEQRPREPARAALPPAARIAPPPTRPAASQTQAPQRSGPIEQPARREVDRPLGRELVEDVDVLDDEALDDLPSY